LIQSRQGFVLGRGEIGNSLAISWASHAWV
jgi:hypothetical protein